MDENRVTSPVAPAAGAFDAREEAMLPAHLRGPTAPAAGKSTRTPRSWLRVALRIVRDATIAVALMTMVPIGIVATGGDRVFGTPNLGNNVRAGTRLAEAARLFRLPADPSITPLQAGRAFHQLHTSVSSVAFPEVVKTPLPEPIWESKLPGELFPSARTPLYGGPASMAIIEAAAKGFTPDEMTYLRTLARDPGWVHFDIVARAQAVDFLGGRFEIPFSPTATAAKMPFPKFGLTRGYAYAAVSRAAYHMAIGQRDSAETVLRSILSYGFNLIDNGTTMLDQMIGNVVVGIGRDGMRRFYVVTSDPRAAAPGLANISKEEASTAFAATTVAYPAGTSMRDVFLARATDPAVARGERFHSLNMLSMSSCMNVRELLFGRGPAVNEAFRVAGSSLARYPSERAFVDMMSRTPLPTSAGPTNPIEALAVSAATVAGTVLNNPRLAACTRVITGNPGEFR